MPLKLFHGAVEEKPQKACEAPSLTHWREHVEAVTLGILSVFLSQDWIIIAVLNLSPSRGLENVNICVAPLTEPPRVFFHYVSLSVTLRTIRHVQSKTHSAFLSFSLCPFRPGPSELSLSVRYNRRPTCPDATVGVHIPTPPPSRHRKSHSLGNASVLFLHTYTHTYILYLDQKV